MDMSVAMSWVECPIVYTTRSSDGSIFLRTGFETIKFACTLPLPLLPPLPLHLPAASCLHLPLLLRLRLPPESQIIPNIA